jgi:hypothetical protein
MDNIGFVSGPRNQTNLGKRDLAMKKKVLTVLAILAFLQLFGCKAITNKERPISLTTAEVEIVEAIALSSIKKIRLQVDLEVAMK